MPAFNGILKESGEVHNNDDEDYSANEDSESSEVLDLTSDPTYRPSQKKKAKFEFPASGAAGPVEFSEVVPCAEEPVSSDNL